MYILHMTFHRWTYPYLLFRDEILGHKRPHRSEFYTQRQLITIDMNIFFKIIQKKNIWPIIRNLKGIMRVFYGNYFYG